LFWAYLVMAVIVPEAIPASRDVVDVDSEEVSE